MYIPFFPSSVLIMHARRAYLHEHYGFNCTCATCSLPQDASAASDARLAAMVALYSRFSTWQNEQLTGKQAIDTAREIWRTGEKEGYTSERGQLAADAALVAAAHSELVVYNFQPLLFLTIPLLA